MYDAVLSETVTITGHGGDAIEAYSARPLTPGPVGGVVVIHHLPGYDRQTKEFTRSVAVGGFNAVMPNLYSREAPGADPDDAMAPANHGFMQVDSARYHPQSAVDAWGKILDWFGRYLAA
jgi:carboxymethylenebutenolidase